jgi:hypothetical protein
MNGRRYPSISRRSARRKLQQQFYFLFVSVVCLISCVPSIKHNPELAGRRAVEFAQVALVRQDSEKAYLLLSDKTKGYVPLAKFKETLGRLYPSVRPIRVKATDYEPMPGEKAIYIYITAETAGEQSEYTLTMDGSAATDYKVSKITRGSSSYLPATSEKKKFNEPITAS